MLKLSAQDKKRLLATKFVEKITDSHVVFTPEFKIRAVELNMAGKSPVDIFNESGISTSLFREDLPKKSVSRWKKVYLEEGPEGLTEEKRGKLATGRPKGQKFASPEAELEYLRLENDFLKKLHALADLKEKKNSR